MIKLHESYFFLIILLTSLITYAFFSIYQTCDIHCKVYYSKYENYHTKDSEETDSKLNNSYNLEEIYKDNILASLNDEVEKSKNNDSNDEYLSKLLNIPV